MPSKEERCGKELLALPTINKLQYLFLDISYKVLHVAAATPIWPIFIYKSILHMIWIIKDITAYSI